MKNYFYIFIFFLISCKSQDCPPKSVELSDVKYEKYCTMLKDARAKKDYFWEATALGNLKQPPKKVFKLIYKAIKKHDTLCYQIHDYQRLYKKGSLAVTLIKIDTIRWEKLCIECEKKYSLKKYYNKREESILAAQKKIALEKNKLDTTLIDKELVTFLKSIMRKDQSIRGIPFMDNKNPRWKEQKHLDSLNLIAIDSIFRIEKGYPSIERIGYDAISIPWYVLHHQSSAITRRKYQHFIEEAVKKGYLGKSMLETYNERTLIKEDEQRKP